MEIGDWVSVAGMGETYRQARELGIETNIAELEAFGFTVIPPEKTGAPKDFHKRMLDRLVELATEQDEMAVELNKHGDNKPAAGRQIFHLLREDPIFIEAMMHPVTQTMASYMVGQSFKLHAMQAFYKEGAARPTMMHTDSVGVPTPLPAYGTVCNVSWVLTDYTEEHGTFGMVPGSHRFCRHPTDAEQPQFVGGQMDNAMVATVNAEPGSVICFTGNTWHCTYPKTSEGVRAHVVAAFCRNYVMPAESYDDLEDEIVNAQSDEFKRLIGRRNWQGYGEAGPKLEDLLLVRPAYQSQYG